MKYITTKQQIYNIYTSLISHAKNAQSDNRSEENTHICILNKTNSKHLHWNCVAFMLMASYSLNKFMKFKPVFAPLGCKKTHTNKNTFWTKEAFEQACLS